MRGTVVAFDEVAGAGEAVDVEGLSHFFTAAQWRGEGLPVAGMAVEILSGGADLSVVSFQPRPAFTWPWFLFSIQGRVSRREYWLKYTLPLLGMILLVMIAGSLTADSTGHNAVAGWTLVLMFIISLWTGIAVQVKRLHDRGFSGWFILLGIIPILGEYWVAAQVGFLPGKRGANRFGADPMA
ncbi:DUF805 domain-containing protein [Nitrospirillum amazonense]|uniref:Uncharacterized membrane protein YhaH (DUF805 family) n=1 Tax=Nitrospirillum amazonense TaxID=28077 RepID=A0A560K214_9PROT|nr:DUF805 domain-containing protein [Nitrospirillum amazonense]MDG3443757.1 DUF805 domain-containing protein [Nitrospirillum amazonense]TWB77317.1 uncharacterized membrane protein YhaH (DUF805 family) [Nitrospirillum amazonense]